MQDLRLFFHLIQCARHSVYHAHTQMTGGKAYCPNQDLNSHPLNPRVQCLHLSLIFISLLHWQNQGVADQQKIMTKPRITLFKLILADSLSHTHTHTHTHTCTHVHAHAHTHTCTHTHACMHTHTHTLIYIKVGKEAYHFHLLVSVPEWKEQNKVHVSACAIDQQFPQQNKKQCKNITLSSLYMQQPLGPQQNKLHVSKKNKKCIIYIYI